MKSRRSLNLLEICKVNRTCPKNIKKCVETAVREASGQRVVRFNDPDKHNIEAEVTLRQFAGVFLAAE